MLKIQPSLRLQWAYAALGAAAALTLGSVFYFGYIPEIGVTASLVTFVCALVPVVRGFISNRQMPIFDEGIVPEPPPSGEGVAPEPPPPATSSSAQPKYRPVYNFETYDFFIVDQAGNRVRTGLYGDDVLATLNALNGVGDATPATTTPPSPPAAPPEIVLPRNPAPFPTPQPTVPLHDAMPLMKRIGLRIEKIRPTIAIISAVVVYFALSFATDPLHDALFLSHTSIQDGVLVCDGISRERECWTEDNVRAYVHRGWAILGSLFALFLGLVRAGAGFLIYRLLYPRNKIQHDHGQT